MDFDNLFKVDPKDPNLINVNLEGNRQIIENITANVTTTNSNNKFVIVCDCDEVLVSISNKWYYKIKNHPILKDYITPEIKEKLSDWKTILLREDYSLEKWLGINDPAHLDIFYSLYFNDPNFYDDLPPLPFVNHLLYMIDKIGLVEKVYIVSHCGRTLESPCNASKAKWLKRYISDVLPLDIVDKVSFKFLTTDITKADFLNENNIKFNSFIDDSPNVIYDLIEKIKFDNYEVMYPLYGYNMLLDPTKLESEYRHTMVSFHNYPNHNPKDIRELVRNRIDEHIVNNNLQHEIL